MRSRRAAVLVVGATVALAAATIASCALEGDVFTLAPDAETAPPFDSAVADTSADTADAFDAFDAEKFETDLDGAWIHCFPDAPCHLSTAECCVYASLDPFCTEVGTCGDGGRSECDRAGQCEAGLLCCDQPAAFATYGKCLTACPGVQRCESNAECADGGRCAFTTYYPTCQWP